MNMTESELRRLLDRYLQGNATDGEVKLLEDFFKSYDPGDDIHTLYPDELKAEILSNIHNRTGIQKRLLRWNTATKIAATIAVIVIVAFASTIYRKDTVEEKGPTVTSMEQTRRGEKSEFALPDGTVVHLNGGSSLSYSSSFSEERNVTLNGEGYFDVTHDRSRPFTVSAGNSRITVLGTSFNIKANVSQDLEVTLVSGKVNVQSRTERIDLEPGVRAIVDLKTNQIRSGKVDVRQFVSWKDNILYFERTSLPEVVETLERWYDADITIASTSLHTCTITGQYKDESLENVLRSLEFLLNAKIDFQSPKQVTIRGNGCKIH